METEFEKIVKFLNSSALNEKAFSFPEIIMISDRVISCEESSSSNPLYYPIRKMLAGLLIENNDKIPSIDMILILTAELLIPGIRYESEPGKDSNSLPSDSEELIENYCKHFKSLNCGTFDEGFFDFENDYYISQNTIDNIYIVLKLLNLVLKQDCNKSVNPDVTHILWVFENCTSAFKNLFKYISQILEGRNDEFDF